VGLAAALRRLAPSRGLAILRYHAVCDPEGHDYAEPAICVTPDAFRRHARYLARHYVVLALPHAVDVLRTGQTLPPNAVAITFDDGYADNLGAARVLHDHGLTATFYLTAACIGGEQPFWPSEIREFVRRAAGTALTLEVDGERLEIGCGTPSERRVAIRLLARLFKSRTLPTRERLREQLRAQAPAATGNSPMLTWDDVREMHRLGMTIGGHTLTHANLPSAGPAVARDEIIGCKARLEREVGSPITMFSYPNGGAERYFDDTIKHIVREAGFRAATTSKNAFAGPASDLFALERIQVAERLEDLIFALEIERFAFAPRT
jgi:peptidoglycan/xylan/chitin deacetylase (PgdA/CDA1 family)